MGRSAKRGREGALEELLFVGNTGQAEAALFRLRSECRGAAKEGNVESLEVWGESNANG